MDKLNNDLFNEIEDIRQCGGYIKINPRIVKKDSCKKELKENDYLYICEICKNYYCFKCFCKFHFKHQKTWKTYRIENGQIKEVNFDKW